MRYLRFAAWILAALTMMTAIGSSIHNVFNWVLPIFNVDGNRATAGGYTMEVIVAVIAFIMVLWRLLWALEVVRSVSEALDVLKTRTAILSTGLAGLVGMGFINRFFWWQKHMFTGEAFNYVDSYTGAANSAIVTMFLCVIVYALHANPKKPYIKGHLTKYPSGLPTGLLLWLVGWISFIFGMVIYTPQF